MLDKHTVPLFKPILGRVAANFQKAGCTADQVTFGGFFLGLLCVAFIASGLFWLGLLALLANRIADGIDGELARINGSTDSGAFLDICLDFIFYALFPLGFALYDPAANALPAAVLIASFVGTGSSFLAFSNFAGERGITHSDFAYKGLYYLDGLAEGTETILIFVLMCLFPAAFPYIAWLFVLICGITAANRVFSGYMALKRQGH